MKDTEMTRFDTRLSKTQKAFFELACKLGGYRNLTDFILGAVQSKAEEIVEKHNKILASEKDQEIFFDYVFNGIEPNNDLKSALSRYNNLLQNG